MEKNSQSWSEIVFGSSHSTVSQAIRRAVLKGVLRKLAPRLYSSNLKDAPEVIIKRHLYYILGAYFPSAILSHRTALEGGPSPEGMMVLTYSYSKTITLPGITIRLIKGPGPQLGDTPFMDTLFLASRARALLENLQSSRNHKDYTKTVLRASLEMYLDKLCRTYGVEELNRLRDTAQMIAKSVDWGREFKQLHALIGASQGTHTINVLTTPAGLARAHKLPYDVPCLELLANLVLALQEPALSSPKTSPILGATLNHLAFFDAYFSNYIEGTEFEVEEAADIIFRGKLTPYRPEDAHDILGTFKLVSDLLEMSKVPQSVEQLYDLLKTRHRELLSARLEKNPGEFKQKLNRAGNTIFVQPDLVQGTLAQGFDLYQTLTPGIARAIFMMFLIAEVHPFLDGNGRIARIMMNAEFIHAHECRIIIPTVYREDYILALRRLSRAGDPKPYIRMLQRAQAFTHSIDFSNYASALIQLTQSQAFSDPAEGKLTF